MPCLGMAGSPRSYNSGRPLSPRAMKPPYVPHPHSTPASASHESFLDQSVILNSIGDLKSYVETSNANIDAKMNVMDSRLTTIANNKMTQKRQFLTLGSRLTSYLRKKFV